jgi:hypothetical protein
MLKSEGLKFMSGPGKKVARPHLKKYSGAVAINCHPKLWETEIGIRGPG